MNIKKYLPSWIKASYRFFKNMPSEKKEILAKSIRLEQRAKQSNALFEKLYDGCLVCILNGPFKGMKYIGSSNGSQLLPKLVGCYEEPIHKWIYEIIEKGKYATIIDVGCAEGYYAAGFAAATKSKPKILAFDIDKHALENAKKLAEINGVSDAIYFRDKFNASIVDKIYEANPNMQTLVFMDVEGAELELLNPITGPAILRCDILVECHDCFNTGLTERIIGYFQKSHYLEIVVDYPWRKKNYFLNRKEFTREDEQLLFDERRSIAMRWMYAIAK